MKSGVKQIAEPIESAMDRVGLMTFPCTMPNNAYTVNATGSVSRQLSGRHTSLSLPQTSITLPSRSVKEAVMVVIRKLKTVPSGMN